MAANAERATDTIFALSSGRPPAAIAIIRISGPGADAALHAIAGPLPAPRHAVLRTIRSRDGEMLDRALVLRFSGPDSATGEDVAEIHCHGGIAVIAAIGAALRDLGLREAEPGEFTRRALIAGRIDPSEIEGLANLLAAETETQRRDAVRRFDGALGRLARTWHAQLIELQALAERLIDHDEDDENIAPLRTAIRARRDELAAIVAGPSVERLRDGVRVVFAGAPNAGKSSLFNALLGSDAAIVSARPGTTRDAIERAVTIDGIPFVLIDTAGLRDTTDVIEAEGVARATRAASEADIVLAFDDTVPPSRERIVVSTKCDVIPPSPDAIATSAVTGAGIVAVREAIASAGRRLAIGDGSLALDARHREKLREVLALLDSASRETDLVVIAEILREATVEIGVLAGYEATEAMLDALFSRFCLGK